MQKAFVAGQPAEVAAPSSALFGHEKVRNLAEQRVRRLDHRVAQPLVKRHGVLPGVKQNFPQTNGAGLGFQVFHQSPPRPLPLGGLRHCHHAYLPLAGGGSVEPPHGQGRPAGIGEQRVRHAGGGIVGEVFGAGGLLPGLAQHGVAQGVVGRPGGGGARRADEGASGWGGGPSILHLAKMHPYLCGPAAGWRPALPFAVFSFTFCLPLVMASFDIVSKVDPQTLENAVNTAKKELLTRYDLRDTKGGIELNKKDNVVVLSAENDMRIGALEDILLSRVVKQGIDGTSLDFTADIAPAGNLVKKTIKVRAGVDKEFGRKIIKAIKDAKVKVEAQMQDDQVRVTAKKIDDLQAAIAVLRKTDIGLPLQFVNMKS